jgi:very-short-patch-repair endonuclease
VICEKGREVIASCQGCALDEACYGCLKTYRNQKYHEQLSRTTACRTLEQLATDVVRVHDIPPAVLEGSGPSPLCESDAEQWLEQLLRDHSFPVPAESQYRVAISDGETTVADFAYPAEKVLVYVDGLSEKIHGNPQQRLKDTLLRTKAKMAGFRVIEISAQGLTDPTSVAVFLNELAVYLGRTDLLVDRP